MENRLRRVCLGAGGLLLCGLAYALWLRVVGLGIPCIFHTLTGLDCPSCGVTRMCMALLRLDFKAAFHCNAAIFCLLPLGIAVAARQTYVYVRYGRMQLERWAMVSVVLMIVVLLVFGVVRNLV